MSEVEFYPKEVWKLAINIALSSFIYCYAISSMNSCTDNIAETLGWGSSYILRSIFTTIYVVGAVIGTLIGAPISARIGIRRTIIVFNMLFIFASFIGIIPSNYTFGACRFVTGIVGGVFITVPAVFINEMTPDAMAGQIGTLIQHACNLAFLVSYALGMLVPTENLEGNPSNYIWMLLIFFPAFFSVYQIYYFTKVFKYENPGWLIKQGRVDEARSALGKIYKGSSVEAGIRRLKKEETSQDSGLNQPLVQNDPSLIQMMCSKKHSKLMRIAILLNVGQQGLGNGVILLYSTKMFETMGGGKFFARFLTFIEGIVLVVAGLFSIILLNRFGRKTILITGSLSCAIILMCLGFFNGIIDGGVALNSILIFGYFFAFIPSMGATFWAYIGEVCNDKAISAGLTFNMTTLIFLTFTFPIIEFYLGIASCFFIYAGMSLLLVVYQLLDLFETKGLTKQEIIKKLYKD